MFARVCPDGFIFFNKSCYYFSDEKLRHGDARSQCEGNTSQLVSIGSKEESDFLFKKIKRGNYWIGANGEPTPADAVYNISASNVSQSLFWDDGTAVTYIDPFGDFRGNTFNNPDGCYVILISGDTKRWKDYDCQRPCRFVCEYKGK
ncbi:hypothetical protein BSL78_21184 [Apostichopus japonicus]|uniref:C-type lectin domain-containing protein n=1 Tax=Stichopus japonicus TaxID=307972 RepID=A0A2G8K1U0_STIJA|nr:hypothetical protein BSL78_21184 [Apostichopus japonicus]